MEDICESVNKSVDLDDPSEQSVDLDDQGGSQCGSEGNKEVGDLPSDSSLGQLVDEETFQAVVPKLELSDGDDIINNGDDITNDGDNVTNDGEDISRDSEDVTYEDISNEQKPTGCVANCSDSPEAPAWELPIDAASPVVSQLRLLVKQCFSSDDTNTPELCFEFPSLLSNPEFEPLVQTYLR